MAKNGSLPDTASGDYLWVFIDEDTEEFVKTGNKGLLAVYTTREDARAARKAGRVRAEGTVLIQYDVAG